MYPRMCTNQYTPLHMTILSHLGEGLEGGRDTDRVPSPFPTPDHKCSTHCVQPLYCSQTFDTIQASCW